MNAEPPTRPQQELRDTLDISKVACCLGMSFRKRLRDKMGNVPIRLFKGNPDWNRLGGGMDQLTKRAVREDGRAKAGIQHRQDARSDQSKAVVVVHNARA